MPESVASCFIPMTTTEGSVKNCLVPFSHAQISTYFEVPSIEVQSSSDYKVKMKRAALRFNSLVTFLSLTLLNPTTSATKCSDDLNSFFERFYNGESVPSLETTQVLMRPKLKSYARKLMKKYEIPYEDRESLEFELVLIGEKELERSYLNRDPNLNRAFPSYLRRNIFLKMKAEVLDFRYPNFDRQDMHDLKMIFKFQDAYRNLHNGLRPSVNEISNSVNIGAVRIENLLNKVKRTRSLDTLGAESYEKERPLITEDANQRNPDAWIMDKELTADVHLALDRLTSRDRLIFQSYYFREMTMEEIGALVNLSRERVRQILTSGPTYENLRRFLRKHETNE